MKGGRDKRIPEALFNITNDSWYGDTIQPLEHLVLASFRSIEHRRPLVRSTNTGISAIVDPAGRIAQRTPQWKRASLAGTIPLMQGRTVYGVTGDWIGWVCAIITLMGIGKAFQARGRLAKSGAGSTAAGEEGPSKQSETGRRKSKGRRDG